MKSKISKIIFMVFAFFLFSNVNADVTPINITSVEDLAKIGKEEGYPAGGSYVLTNDITIGSTWTSPFDESNVFTGIFDGKNHTITYNMDMSQEEGEPKSFKYKTIFYNPNEASFKNFKLVVNTKKVRSALTYSAYDTSFENITIEGTMESNDQMGPLSRELYNGSIINVNSYVNFKLKNLDFSKYYTILGGIVAQLTSTDMPWNDLVPAIFIAESNYYGNINTDFTSAVTGNKYYYLGGIFGCTAYESPNTYYGIAIEMSSNKGTYTYTGSLPAGITQYNYKKADGTMAVTYTEGNIGGNAKPIDELSVLGRVHQNIHVNLYNGKAGKVTYGYYGLGASTEAGTSSWDTVSAPSIVSISTKEGTSTGRVTGLYTDEKYEYKLKSASTWIEITNKEEITGLAAGEYEIRFKVAGATNAIASFTIAETKVTPIALDAPSSKDIIFSLNPENLSDEIFEERNSGNEPYVNIDVVSIPEDDEDYANDISKIKETLGTNDKIAAIVDLSILLNVGNASQEITELIEPLTFKLEIPENLRGKGHTFYLINIHNDEVIKIEGTVTEDGKYVEFEISKFSTLALAYEPAANNPKTNDNIIIYCIVGMICLLSLGLIFAKLRSKK